MGTYVGVEIEIVIVKFTKSDFSAVQYVYEGQPAVFLAASVKLCGNVVLHCQVVSDISITLMKLYATVYVQLENKGRE